MTNGTLLPMIIDAFAGGGGASVGIEMALGRSVDIAINHDPAAILMHKTNHPDTLHLTEDIFKVNLQKYVKGRHVALMWASPDCTSHSKAKGGQPRNQGLRILPWAVYKHAKVILPDVIIMENVEEIQRWGPLDETGHPIKERAGEDYNKFINAMVGLGYVFECRELVAADYGAPTTRKRWYAIFRRDGRQIVWPEPTHNRYGTNGLKKWVPICSILDFSDLGRSIFARKKPLAENTMKRIARGLQKFVFECEDPFVIDVTNDMTITNVSTGKKELLNPYLIQVNHSGDIFRGQSMHDPIPTVTGKHGFGKITPLLTPFIDKSYGGNYQGGGSKVDNPVHTITSVDHNRVISPYIMQIGQIGFSKDRNRGVDEPLSTIVTKNEHCIVEPFLIHYHSETKADEVRGQKVDEPIKTIDTSNRYASVSAFLTKFYKTGIGQSMFEPIHTITTSAGHFGQVSVLTVKLQDLMNAGVPEDVAQKCTWVSEFIIEYYGSGTGQKVSEPLHTIVTKDRFALITVLGNEYVILDIYLRMLSAEELKLAQGFPADYIIDRDYRWNTYPASERVKRIGNSVVPIMAEKIVSANCSYLKVKERQPLVNTGWEENGQMRMIV